jgi:hypothetical protein
MNGTVQYLYMLADTSSGERVKVPLNSRGVGIGKADIESQLHRIVDDPSLLQVIADAWAQLHPDADRYLKLYLMRDTYQLAAGRQDGAPATETLATWEVQP